MIYKIDEIELKINAFEHAYRCVGSRPCEDCELRRHGRHDCPYWPEELDFAHSDDKSLRCQEAIDWDNAFDKEYYNEIKNYIFHNNLNYYDYFDENDEPILINQSALKNIEVKAIEYEK